MANDMLLRALVRATIIKQQVQERAIKTFAALAACSPVAAFADGDDVAAMLRAGADGATSGTKSTLDIAQFLGVVFVVGALIAAKNKKDNPQIKVSHIAGGILFGVCLVVVPEIIKRTQRQVGLTPVSVG